MDNAFVLLGFSVSMHVVWNLLARHVNAQCNYLWWGLLTHLLLIGSWSIWHLVINSEWTSTLIVALFITALANTFYFLCLNKAYRFAPVALVYPIARSSPILIVAWSWLIFAKSISMIGSIGIAISIFGLWLLASTAKKGNIKPAIVWALLAALATSVYSISDKIAVQYLPSFSTQLGFISIGYLASFIGLSLYQYRENGSVIPPCRPKLIYMLIGGLFIGTAYALVVRAMLYLPAAYVVAYTNVGIVLATVLSIWVFHENEHWIKRLLATAIITCGLIILGLEKHIELLIIKI